MDTNKLLRAVGINDPDALRLAANLASEGYSEEDILSTLREKMPKKTTAKIPNNKSPLSYAKFGIVGQDIPYNVIEQMDQVMRLPPAIKGALMPDAHLGYGMPIGGVVAMLNVVSPSFVGYDIACRMTVSFLDLDVSDFFEGNTKSALFDDMLAVSRFGVGSEFDEPHDHEIMFDPLWQELPHLRDLKTLARKQLGSSGGGNHFFDMLVGEVVAETTWLPFDVGDMFVAIMTHSGSRGTGHKMAQYYQKLATKQTNASFSGIPKGYEFLRMNTDAGREYWNVMQLMGSYAQANHHIIHDSFLQRVGIASLGRMENHHNFAWFENGLYIHRKGATPAALGQLGIIPGSSGTASFLVEGLGNEESLNSSSHGAGRLFSRREAKERFDEQAFIDDWTKSARLYSNIAPDETAQSYKDIERVIELQEGTLVRVVARMMPEMVIMGGNTPRRKK